MRFLVILGVCLTAVAAFLFMPVRHTIDKVEVKINGVQGEKETWVHAGWKIPEGMTARATRVDENGLAVFENVPAATNTVYVVTDRCPGTVENPNVLLHEFTMEETSRFVRLKWVRVEFDLNTCSYTFMRANAPGFVW